jgi:hypothetical protein
LHECADRVWVLSVCQDQFDACILLELLNRVRKPGCALRILFEVFFELPDNVDGDARPCAVIDLRVSFSFG